MKRVLLAIAALALMFACSKGESKKSGGDDNCPKGAVDLGIVMTRGDGTTYKLYWAESNLCANGFCANPQDYGDYFAWGETYSKEDYGWSAYLWYDSESHDVNKYTMNNGDKISDNLTELQRGEKAGETIDDAARAILKGKWRMPTYEEFQTLIDSCTWTWVENYNDSGNNGCLVTSNVEGFNDASIFLPASGFRYMYMVDERGMQGYYWTSTLYTKSAFEAFDSSFYSNNGVASPKIFHTTRYFGFPIRPVTE